ncbi:MAG: response regulator [bacterium]|nr:response regulator [bacterium]
MENFEHKKILIVDDDISMREIMGVILEKEYQLLFAEDGETALEILKKEKEVGLIFLDIILPGINGMEVLEKVKKSYPDIWVIMMSIVKDAEVVVEAMRIGAKDYIVKKIDYDIILKMVKKAFSEIGRKGLSLN